MLQPLEDPVVVQAGEGQETGAGKVALPDATRRGWPPREGSYEEAVLSWHEQVEVAFRRRASRARGEGAKRERRTSSKASGED
jgi:hypothetical protein